MRDPIIITGAARSGTSLTTGIIDICGGFGGKVTGPTLYNEKGQFENTHVREDIVKPYLVRLGVDRLAQRPLPDVNKLIPFPELRKEVEDTFIREGYSDNGRPWYYKAVKVCLVWPVWRDAFPDARWIIVRRDGYDIANSCLRTGFMRAYSTQAGWLEWVAEHVKRFDEMKEAGMDVTEIHSEDIVNGDHAAIRKFVDETDGLEWDQEQIDEFITPSLWKEGKV